MANIFRSKEIYKRIPNVPNDQNPLRAVRGVYVAGEWREVYYIDATVAIKNIETTTATVVDFTTVSKNVYDASINLLSIDSPNVDVAYYTTDSKTTYDSSINLLSINVGELDITEYQSVSKSTYDSSINLLSVVYSDLELGIYTSKGVDTNYDFTIRIKTLSSTPATITNIT